QDFSYTIAEEPVVGSVEMFEDFETSNSVSISPANNASGEITTNDSYSGYQSLLYSVLESGDPTVENGSLLVGRENSIDASSYDYLSFWVKDTQGNNGIKVALQDGTGQESSFENVWFDGAIKDTWTPISVPLSEISDIDLSNLKGVRFGEWNSGSYYIDHIQLTDFSLDDLNIEASIPSGSYTETQFVSLSNNTDATIYYTVDGTEPTTSSAVYEGAINVSNDMTIRAVAEKDGVMGQVSVYRYTISIFQVENTEPTWLQLFDY